MNKIITITILLTALLLGGCSNMSAMEYGSTSAPIGLRADVMISQDVSTTHIQDPSELVPTYGDQSYGDEQQYDTAEPPATEDTSSFGDESITDNSDSSHEAVACAREGQNLTREELGIASVEYQSDEAPGTLFIHTGECAAYYLLGDGKAARVRVAVGKEGFEWQGVAYVHDKRIDPTWTPPSEMIARRPELAKWSQGMPGGIPENPLGTRAMYLYDQNGNDTMYRIHGTAEPKSIGHRASSGCIRVYPGQIEVLFDHMQVGSKVIVMQ